MMDVADLGFQVRSLLGTGSFAQVYECLDLKDNKFYALKMIDKQVMGRSKLRAFSKQAEILAKTDHNNIIKFHSFHQTEQYLLIKMQLMRGGTLKRLLETRKQNRQHFSAEQVAIFLRNLLEGVKYLHSLNIIHRDLKPENILFADSSDLSSLKIVDFGLSAKLQMNYPSNVKSQCGTLLYMAPEMFNKPSYTKSVDLWSVSVITYMMFNEGSHPLHTAGMKVDQFKLKLKLCQFPSLKDAMAQNFIEKLSKKQYEERYNVNDALKHPFITRNKDDQIPLSIHQSYKGFDSSFEIINALRLFVGIAAIIPHKKKLIEESYRFKVFEFNRNNQASRVASPSRRGIRDRNNHFFNKMKQIFQQNSEIKVADTFLYQQQEIESPTLKKHDKFYISLFEKQKSIDLRSLHDLNLVMAREPMSAKPFQKRRDRKQFTYTFFQKRSMSLNYPLEEQPAEEQLQNPKIQEDSVMDKNLQMKIQQQIQEQVNSVKGHHRGQRRIFQKKESSVKKQAYYDSPEIVKRHSVGYQKQKQTIKTNIVVPILSGRALYNRRAMSPLKLQYSKPMSFAMGKTTKR